MKKIAIITDFGNSHYAGIIKGVISSIDEKIQVIDITHHITPQNIVEAAFVLKESLPYFDKDTIFLVVVDPSVGSKRRGVVLKSEGRYFVGPDNGLFEYIYEKGDYLLYEIIKPDFYTERISNTFHARDIFAPLAAYIASEKDVSDIIKEAQNPIRLEIPRPEIQNNFINGKILYIDSFGNLITNIPEEMVKNKRCSVKIKNRRLGRIRNIYTDVPRGFPLALIGSSNMVEIAVNSGSAEKWFNIKRDRIKNIKVTINIH